MKMRKEDKAALVDEIADRLGDAEAIFAVDYRGITVPQAAELRAKLTEADATFRVVKNRLAKRATERAGTDELDPLFEGPTALALVKGDAVTAAKTISTFGRQHDILEYKGGLMDGVPLDPDQFRAIARLPGLDVLRGQLVAVVASPITGLTRGLASMLSGLAIALGQISEQGLVGGEAKEPAEEEPARASDEVAEAASEPAVPPEPAPAGNVAEGEASGGDAEPSDEEPTPKSEEEAPPPAAEESSDAEEESVDPADQDQETSDEIGNDEAESSEESGAEAKDSEESTSEEEEK